MRYLILDKKQRVKNSNDNNLSTASVRIQEELNKKNIPHDFAYWEDVEIIFTDGETSIKANGKDIKEYSHIIFRGHDLHNPIQYETKRYIVDYVDQINSKSNGQKILVQNSEVIKRFPYYNKIAIGMFCLQYNIPYFNTYYRLDGDYTQERDVLNEYPLIMKEYAGVNRVQIIDGEEKIKKNVYKIDNIDGYNQEFLRDQDHSRFFIQEFSNIATDMRIFVKMGKIIGGWKRYASDGFMTVKDGIYEMYNNPGQEEREIAEKVAQALGADFIAVDLMYMNDKPLLQELSLHPGFKAYETKIEGEPANIAEAIITAFPN